MNTYVAIRSNFQLIPEASGKPIWLHIRTWLSLVRKAWAHKKTDWILAGLDRSVLEDIGVPHDGVSPRAGVLERYPRIITPERRGC